MDKNIFGEEPDAIQKSILKFLESKTVDRRYHFPLEKILKMGEMLLYYSENEISKCDSKSNDTFYKSSAFQKECKSINEYIEELHKLLNENENVESADGILGNMHDMIMRIPSFKWDRLDEFVEEYLPEKARLYFSMKKYSDEIDRENRKARDKHHSSEYSEIFKIKAVRKKIKPWNLIIGSEIKREGYMLYSPMSWVKNYYHEHFNGHWQDSETVFRRALVIGVMRDMSSLFYNLGIYKSSNEILECYDIEGFEKYFKAQLEVLYWKAFEKAYENDMLEFNKPYDPKAQYKINGKTAKILRKLTKEEYDPPEELVYKIKVFKDE